jgi:hypothetical protein
MENNLDQTSFKTEQLSIAFDQHEIFTLQAKKTSFKLKILNFKNSIFFHVQGMHIFSQHHSEQMRMERQSHGILTLPTNRAWVTAFDKILIVFPYKYNFAECFDEVN